MKKRQDLLGRVGSRIGSAVDDAILGALSRRFSAGRPRVRAPKVEPLEHGDRRALLAEAIAFYRRPEILSGERFFLAPERPRVVTERRGALPQGGELVDLKWESAFVPAWERVREDYQSHAPNRDAYVRLLRQNRAAPTIVCLHGYRGGAFVLEERAFPTRWLYSLGLNVVLFQLPFHGHRGGPGAPVWPSVNVARANEGFAHAIYDLRALRRWLDEVSGRQPLAVCGMSLGGYTTALLATVEKLDLAVPMIPVASFPDLLWDHGAGRPERARAEREGITVEMLRQAMEVHTPLSRVPLVPPERVLVVSAEGDRIAPPEHAARLARHFGAEELRFVGGHVLQLGRRAAFSALARRLAKAGLIPERS
ncbi:MAG TPA: alpha/beta hydrolase family protein [Polyangia bacterium]